ncbi:Gfo/Idh/MocA family protein [Pseudogracilibacillus sp. SO30301A]|uniref:Gfo/Idh/MocA family protein n=1 Tax=Pseudogracilibacillus sp. SO30301A TaxID=3098291 RepID=UPI00300DD510
MTTSKINWGILSTASIAQEQMIPAILQSKNANALAIASQNGKERIVAEKFQIPRAYCTYESLLEDSDIDIVYVPLPNSLHSKWVKEVAKAGKHVLCEKPASLTEKETIEMIKVCEEHNVIFMEAFMYQFHPQHKRVRDIIATDEIGEIKLIHSSFSFLLNEIVGNFRMNRNLGGGSIYDVGCYSIHAIRTITNSEPKFVKAISKNLTGYDVDISAIVVMELGNGVQAYFDCAMDMPSRHMYEVIGTEGTITVSKAFITQTDGEGIITVTNKNGLKREEIIYGHSYTLGVEHFSDCVLTNKEPIYTKDNTIKNMRAIEACIKSLDTGSTIIID